jgi:general stress protein 26
VLPEPDAFCRVQVAGGRQDRRPRIRLPDTDGKDSKMADLDKTRSAAVEQLWDELDKVHAGMLGVEGSGQHMQPMAPQLDPEGRRIWFFSRDDSDLARAAGSGAKAHFCVIGEDHDYHACLSGALRQNRDQARIDAFWSPVVAAWFEGGKADPALTLLELELSDAAIWASSNPIRFGWEIAKANVTEGEPDVGVRTHVRFGT